VAEIHRGTSPLGERHQKRLLLASSLCLGRVSVAQAQVSCGHIMQIDGRNAARISRRPPLRRREAVSATSPRRTRFRRRASLSPRATFRGAGFVARPLALFENAEPAPTVAATSFSTAAVMTTAGAGSRPRVVAIRSSVSMPAPSHQYSGESYVTKRMVRSRGELTRRLCSTIVRTNTSRLKTYGAGPKIAWRQKKRWEALAAEFWRRSTRTTPRLRVQARNSYAIKAGGGSSYRWNQRLFISPLEGGTMCRTGFFTSQKNNSSLRAGLFPLLVGSRKLNGSHADYNIAGFAHAPSDSLFCRRSLANWPYSIEVVAAAPGKRRAG